MRIPDSWKAVYDEIRRQDEAALLAGGALRDLYFGKPAKDLDIFVQKDVDLTTREELNLAKSAEVDPGVVSQKVFLGHGDCLPVNIIRCNKVAPYDRMRNFDFGICKIWYDGDVVNMHPHFWHDVRNECFTFRKDFIGDLLERSKTIEYSVIRFIRLGPKYPGWPLVFPDRETRKMDPITYNLDADYPDLCDDVVDDVL